MNAYKAFAVLLLAGAPSLAFAQYGGGESRNSIGEMNTYRYPSTSIPRDSDSIPNSRSIPSQNPEPVGPRSIPGDSRSIPSP